VIGEAWAAEQPLLREIPDRIVSSLQVERSDVPARVIDLSALRAVGDVVQERVLDGLRGGDPREHRDKSERVRHRLPEAEGASGLNLRTFHRLRGTGAGS
jgi:hypothetical protein